MYFPFEINEQLANAMKAVAKAKAEINIFMKSEEARDIKRVDPHSINELDEILCSVVCQIANLYGCVIADDVLRYSNDCGVDANKDSASSPTFDTGKEPIYLSDYSRNEINKLRGWSVETSQVCDKTYLYSIKAYICDVISGLVERIDTPSKEDSELYKCALCVLCDYKRLIDELSKVQDYNV